MNSVHMKMDAELSKSRKPNPRAKRFSTIIKWNSFQGFKDGLTTQISKYDSTLVKDKKHGYLVHVEMAFQPGGGGGARL